MERPTPSPFRPSSLSNLIPRPSWYSSSPHLVYKRADQALSLAYTTRPSSINADELCSPPIHHYNFTPTSTTPQRASPRVHKAPQPPPAAVPSPERLPCHRPPPSCSVHRRQAPSALQSSPSNPPTGAPHPPLATWPLDPRRRRSPSPELASQRRLSPLTPARDSIARIAIFPEVLYVKRHFFLLFFSSELCKILEKCGKIRKMPN